MRVSIFSVITKHYIQSTDYLSLNNKMGNSVPRYNSLHLYRYLQTTSIVF
jgi:hypothetical protein